MKKLFLPILFALSLAGCAGSLPSLDLSTPVARNSMAGVLSAYGIALNGARAYKALCANHTLARASCGPIVVQMQAADRKAVAAMDAAVDFTVKYPTVDASNFISAASAAVGSLEGILAAAPR